MKKALLNIEVLQPGAVNQSEAETYVGGRKVFRCLAEAFPELLVPFIRRPRVTFYRVALLDECMKGAEASGVLRDLKNEN